MATEKQLAALNRDVPENVERDEKGVLRKKIQRLEVEEGETRHEAMRHVSMRPEKEDRTYQQQSMRAYMKKHRSKFEEELSGYDRGERERGRAEKEMPKDEDGERVEDLIQRMIEKARRK